MKYIDINDAEKISENIKALNECLTTFSKPEDIIALSKIIKKNIPFYRRRDFYAFMTYLNLQNMPYTSKKDIDRKTSGINKESEKGSQQFTMWMNYAVRGGQAASEFKAYLSEKAKIDESEIIRINPGKYYSFVNFKTEKALSLALSSLQGVNYKGKVLKVNRKDN